MHSETDLGYEYHFYLYRVSGCTGKYKMSSKRNDRIDVDRIYNINIVLTNN